MNQGDPSVRVQARCQDCRRSVDLPEDERELLIAFRQFLDAHDRCVFNVTVGRAIDLRDHVPQGRPAPP